MKNKINKRKSGYTIIETMISVSLFLVVVMAGMGALLNANLLHYKSNDMRSIMDNLSFIMEDMSKSIRAGLYYHCIEDANNIGATEPHSCETGEGISFFSTILKDSQWEYYVKTNPNDSSKLSIFKTVGGQDEVQLTPDEVNITQTSIFSVLGAEAPNPCIPTDPPPGCTPPSTPGNLQQPFVTIRLVGKIIIPSKGIETPFSLQTSVSQRAIDI